MTVTISTPRDQSAGNPGWQPTPAGLTDPPQLAPLTDFSMSVAGVNTLATGFD
jgi:hypothetical protein